jgi:hypothetical protein
MRPTETAQAGASIRVDRLPSTRVRVIATLALSVVCGILGPRNASACSCLGPNPACRAFWTSSAVFVGDVMSIEDLPATSPPEPFLSTRRVHLRVRETFSGRPTSEVDVLTGRGGGDCGYPFAVGEAYVVFANARADGGLSTGICDLTKPLTEAATDLAYLRALPTMTETKARIFGRAEMWDDDESGATRPPRTPYAGAKVVAAGSAGRFTAVTGTDGSFEIRVPVGAYDVTAEVANGRYADVGVSIRPLTLPDLRACAETDVSVHSDGHVSGRVLDAHGRPVAGLTVEAAAEPAFDQAYFFPRHEARTAADGTFAITNVPPGDYVIGFNTRRGAGLGPYPRVLYSSNHAASPSVVALGAGARVAIGDFVVPPAVVIVPIAGVVRRDDGQSVEGTKIYLEGDDPRDFMLVGEPAVVDARGRFLLAGVSGYRYRVVAERSEADPRSGSRRLIQSDVVEVTATPVARPLVLTLSAGR